MSRTITTSAFCLVLAVSLIGCRKEPAPAPPAGNPPAPAAEPADQPAGDATKTGENAKSAEIEAAFASLSVEDRALAEKQKICPVSGEGLGMMGAPIKVDVAGQAVFICCEHCKEPLLEKPTEYPAKIGLKPAAESAPQ